MPSKNLRHILLCICLFLLASTVYSQSNNNEIKVTTEKTSVARGSYEKKNPGLALGLSAVLPGAGQVYNGQWYKVPIIYGLGFTLGYFYVQNKDEMDIYKKEFSYRSNGDTNMFNPDLSMYSTDNIKNLRDYYQRNMQLMIILSVGLYALNLIDAVVFANLASFDISDNLSMRISPYATPRFDIENPMAMNAGLKLTFQLK